MVGAGWDRGMRSESQLARCRSLVGLDLYFKCNTSRFRAPSKEVLLIYDFFLRDLSSLTRDPTHGLLQWKH